MSTYHAKRNILSLHLIKAVRV